MISGTRHRLDVEINRQTRLAQAIARLQTDISTAKRIQTPSDDPSASATISELARTQAQEATWARNLDFATALADRSDTALAELSGAMERVTELVTSAATGTLSAANRATIAAELRGIVTDITALAGHRDPQGDDLFRTDAELQIPVQAGGTLAAVAARAAIFDTVQTPAGVMSLAAIITAAADAAVEPDPALRAAAFADSLDAVRAATEHVAAVRADQGVRAKRIDGLRERLELSKVQLSEQRGALEGTDLIDAIPRLQALQLNLQAAQAVFARVNQTTLFDLLR